MVPRQMEEFMTAGEPDQANMSADVDQADASAGGCGAPPQKDRHNEAPTCLTREYRTDSISVLWFAERCIHSGECIRALPRVFNPRRRPWVAIDRADADAIADAVLRCPTGALHYVRHDGGPDEPVPQGVEVRVVHNGPYFIRGALDVRNDEGQVIRSDTRMALCRCGSSKHMPFCDNSHREIGFDDSSAP